MDLFGGAKKTKKATKTKKTSETKKTKSSTKKTSDAKKPTKSKTKGGNFLGAVGDLVAPTGWGPFATAAGLLALDRADAALRRGTKEKKEKMKGGKEECRVNSHVSATIAIPIQFNFYDIYNKSLNKKSNNYREWNRNYFSPKEFGFDDVMTIYFINNDDNTFSLKIEGNFVKNEKQEEFSHCLKTRKFTTLQEAKEFASNANNQKNLAKLLVKEYARTRNTPIKLRNDFFELRNYST